MAYARMHAIRFLNTHHGMCHTPPDWEQDNSHDDEYYEVYFSLGDLTTAMAECCGEYARKIRRRQHAVTVWNAMAAVAMVVATYECVENHCLPGGLLPDLEDWWRCMR